MRSVLLTMNRRELMLRLRLSLLSLRKCARMNRYELFCFLSEFIKLSSKICVAPPPAAAYGYQAQAECAKEYRHVCYKEPVLVPLVKKVQTYIAIEISSVIFKYHNMTFICALPITNLNRFYLFLPRCPSCCLTLWRSV